MKYEKKCEVCLNIFEVYLSRKNTARFCSKKCMYQVIKVSPIINGIHAGAYKNLQEVLDKYTKWNGECLEWIGTVLNTGYGNFGFRYKHYSPHRAAWEINHGKIPKGLLIRHKCNNKICCRIDHLDIGTHADNNRDTRECGRHYKGSQHWKTILDEEKVKEIKKLIEKGISCPVLGRMYNVHRNIIYRIRDKKSWKHLN